MAASQIVAQPEQSTGYKTFSGIETHFQETQFRDIFFGLLFWLHIVGFVGYMGYRVHGILQNPFESTELEMDALTGHFPVLFIVSGIALSLALLWTVLVRSFPKAILYTAVFLPLVIEVLICASLVAVADYKTAGFAGLAIVGTSLYIWCIWSCLGFTALLLETTVKVAHQQYGVFVLAVASLLPSALLLAFYLLASAILKHDLEDSDGDTTEAWGLSVFTLFSFYWSFATLSNLVHTTICGVVGRWYFLDQERSATCPALRQSITTSFGAIALGSLIMALIRTVKALLRLAQSAAEDQDNLVALILFCILRCVVSCIEAIFEFISTYAYVYVAICGTSFCEGAKRTFKLLNSSGLQAIVAYDLSGSVAFLGALFCGCASGLATWGLIWAHGDWLAPGQRAGGDVALTPGYIGLGAFMGFAAALLVSSVIESGACALLVCYADGPEPMEQRCPALSNKIREMQAEAEPAQVAQAQTAGPTP